MIEPVKAPLRCNYIHVTKGQCVKTAHLPNDPKHLWFHPEMEEPKVSLDQMTGKVSRDSR